MGDKMRQVGLVVFGVIAGVMLSLNFSAVANKEETQEIMHPLPVEELRAFTEVFGRIKTDYVEPVQDKKLITEAINGMLTGLDPHSAYLDADAFKELQIGTQGEFGGLGIEVSMEDGFVKVISPIEDSPAFKAGLKAGDLITRLDNRQIVNANPAFAQMSGYALDELLGQATDALGLVDAARTQDQSRVRAGTAQSSRARRDWCRDRRRTRVPP